MLQSLSDVPQWDVVIIGGGATGLGAAVDAASRGYRTLLVEQNDFAKGTSSRATKLVHGGVRYLEQGNIKLVKEALRERWFLLKNAPHVTSVQGFILPVYSTWKKWYYLAGLRIYDLLSGKWSLGKTRSLSRKETLQHLPSLQAEKVRGGILYFDGQFDDSRLCIDLAATAVAHGAVVLNYCSAIGFIKNNKGKIRGVQVMDNLKGISYTALASAVINATGVFTDAILQMDDHVKHDIVEPSQGIHLVVDRSFFAGNDAMIIPKTDDGRVLFAVPWHDKVILGTTDTPVDAISTEPVATGEEIDFILAHINRYLVAPITRKDVLSVFAGLRPLVKAGPKKTALLARDHTILVSPSGLVTITGGKWTTYRKMAEDAVNNAIFTSRQEKKECITQTLPIGNEAQRQETIRLIESENPEWSRPLHPAFRYKLSELIYAIRYEMAVTVEDILARRTRLLFLDAAIALSLAPAVAAFMTRELGKDAAWQEEEIARFGEVVRINN